MSAPSKAVLIHLRSIKSGQRRPVSIEVARAITRAIDDGHLRSGDRLPPERELARTLAVSRSSLRDALKVLAGVGLLEIRRSRGVYVADPEAPRYTIRKKTWTAAADPPAAEVFELRRILETEATALAATRANAAELEGIDRAYASFSAQATADMLTPRQANEFDIEIHALIAAASGNGLLAHELGKLRHAADEMRAWRDALKPGRIAANVADLGAIVDALRHRDAEAARAAMLEHLKRGEAAVLALRRLRRGQASASSSNA